MSFEDPPDGKLRAALRKMAQNRVRYRITRGGMLFLAALLLTGAGAFLSANNLLFLVFSSMLALLLVSGFLSRLVLAGLELELLLPDHVSARMPTEARIRIRNLKFLMPSFSIELLGRQDPKTRQPPIVSTPLYFSLIPGRETVEAAVQVTFPRRGPHHDNLFLISTRFPFGFLRRSAGVELHRETVVYPSLQPQEEVESLLADIAGEIESHSRGSGLDFYRIRPYEMTDSARLVDWKSTAHTGELQVREFSREEQRSVEIYLDLRTSPAQADWLEKSIEQCAFLTWHLFEREIEVVLRSQDTMLFIGREADVYEALRFLALIAALPPDSNPAPAPSEHNTVQLVFSTSPDEFEAAGWKVSATTLPNTFPLPRSTVTNG